MNKLRLPNAIVLATTKHMTIPNKRFSKKGLHILHLNINCLLLKIDEIFFIPKQSNASIIGISEPKLDAFILNNEADIEEYDLIRMDPPRRGIRIANYVRKAISYNHNSSFCRNTENIFRYIIFA